MGYSNELVTQWDEIADDQRRSYARLISGHMADIAHMIENLLVATRSDIGGLTIIAEACDLAECALEVVEELGIQQYDSPQSPLPHGPIPCGCVRF